MRISKIKIEKPAKIKYGKDVRMSDVLFLCFYDTLK